MRERLHRRFQELRARASKLSRLVRRREYRRGLRSGVAASVEHAAVDFRADYATVVDVGANRGQFALFASSRWPAARLVCFEPLPDARARLEETLGSRAEVHGAALGRESGRLPMHVSARDDSSSLLEVGDRQVAAFPGTEETGVIEVPVETLSEHLSPSLGRPSLLKIDVQGYELEALTGAGDRLEHVDDIFVECSFVELYRGQALSEAVISYLDERGFRLAGVYGVARGADGACLQADFLFRRRSADG